MTWLGFWGVFAAGLCVGYGLHLLLSWATVTDALEEAAELREENTDLRVELWKVRGEKLRGDRGGGAVQGLGAELLQALRPVGRGCFDQPAAGQLRGDPTGSDQCLGRKG